MKTLAANQARKTFGKLLDAVQSEPVLITRRDRPVAAFLSLRDIEGTVWGEAVLRTIAAKTAEAQSAAP